MPVQESSWMHEAQTLGYENEKEMMVDLYVINEFSISHLAKILGYSSFSVRTRLLTWGISLRKRGGPNNTGKRKLKNVSDADLADKPAKVAADHHCHIATVFAEKRLREKEKLITT